MAPKWSSPARGAEATPLPSQSITHPKRPWHNPSFQAPAALSTERRGPEGGRPRAPQPERLHDRSSLSSPTSNNPPDLGSLRNKALEAHILSEALAEELAELPAGSYSEKLQVLANLSERASRETFETADEMSTARP